MSKTIQAVRGMNDLLPQQIGVWQHIESVIKKTSHSYGFDEIRFPVVENTALFKRSIGEVTDIVQKEMYTFDDRNGDSLTLRPEGTASCVRACLQHGLVHNQQQKLWYLGPMFRHERPQKGRYRQFQQFGVEAFGFEGVEIELEMLLMTQRYWDALGLSEQVTLELNTIGTLKERSEFRLELQEFLRANTDRLDAESIERTESNPLRVFDSKNSGVQALLKDAPSLLTSLTNESRERFESLCNALTELGIAFTVNPCLVRGLDYYSHTVFEWITNKLGAQGTVCAGGRYDGLVEQCGGRPNTAVGFAMGVERLALLLEQAHGEFVKPLSDIYIVTDKNIALDKAQTIIEGLRDGLADRKIVANLSVAGFKSQFKKADKSGALYAVVLGEKELSNNTVTIEFLRDKSESRRVIRLEHLVETLKELLGE